MSIRPSPSSRAHLGETAAPLVDGELGHAARDAALAHLAGCARCRAEVDSQRRAKVRISGLTGPVPGADLLARLQAIGSDADRPPPRPSPPPRRPRLIGRRPLPARPPARRPAGGRSRLRYTVAGATSVVLLSVGMSLLGAGENDPGQRITPAVDRFAEEHAATTGEVPFTEPAVGAAVSVSFATSARP